MPPAVGKIIAELGLRYRPSQQADLQAHGHAIRLLTEDVADVPIDLLEAAAREWVRCKPFLPKASELVALAQQARAERDAPRGGFDLAREYNQRLDANGKTDVRWIGRSESLRLVHASEVDTIRRRARDCEAEAKYGDTA